MENGIFSRAWYLLRAKFLTPSLAATSTVTRITSALMNARMLFSCGATLMGFFSVGVHPTIGFFVPTTSPTAAHYQGTFGYLHHAHHVQQHAHHLPALPKPRPTTVASTGSRALLLQMTSTDHRKGGGQSEGVSRSSEGIDGLEVIEREAAKDPLRTLRLITYAVFGLSAFWAISVTGMAGVEQVQEPGRNLPDPLVDLAIIVLSFFFWVEEVRAWASRSCCVSTKL